MPVFSLSEVRSNQIKNYENTFEEQVVSNYGYIAGGAAPALTTLVERLDLATDSVFDASIRVPFTSQSGCNTPGTSDNGYLFGGANPGLPGTVCTICRLQYSNETIQQSTANMNIDRYIFSVGQNSQYGYVIAGYKFPPGQTCLVDRLDFTSETISLSTPFPSGRLYHLGFNSTTHHYFTGGEYGNRVYTSDVSRLNFSTEVIDTISANTFDGANGGTFSDGSAGYYMGGYTIPTIKDLNYRITFDTETSSAVSSLPSGRFSGSGAQTQIYGYYISGFTNPYPTLISTVSRYNFSTDSWDDSLKTTIARAGTYQQSLIGGTKITRGTPKYTNWNEYASYGYYGGGGTPSRQQTLDRIDFNTETLNNQPNTILRDVGFFQATESDAAGYYAGGNTGATGSTNCSKLEFLSETTSILSSYLNTARSNQAAVKSPEGAYISKGGSSNIEKLNFETETFGVSNVFGFDYNTHRGTQNKQYGYYAGGYYTSYIDKIDKHDFSTETIQENQTALNIKSGRQGATETEDYGYFIGGVNESITLSQVQRLDFSSDTVSVRPGGLNTARMDTDATNSISYGFFAGGHIPSPNILSTVERFDYDTETISNPGGVLSQARRAVGTVQGGSALRQVGKNNRNDSRAGLDNQGRQTSASYGYFAGGAPGAPTLTRIDYLNETTTEPSATITLSANGITCLSNVNYGYVTGGYGGSNLVPNISRIDRFDHSNETMKTSSNNLITPTGFLYYSAGNKNYGYVAGGYEQGVSSGYKLSVIQRLDYDTETVDQNNSRLLTGDITNGYAMSHNRNYIYYIGDFDSQTNTCRLDFSTEVITNINNNTDSFYRGVGANTETDGYLLGNLGGGYKSTIYKLDFSSETLSSISNKLSREVVSVSGNQNTNYGYIGGGDTPTTPITTSYIDRFEFSTETASNPGNPMTRSRRQNAGFANLPAF